jgi:phosphoribosyl-dephospho-CoA transferase
VYTKKSFIAVDIQKNGFIKENENIKRCFRHTLRALLTHFSAVKNELKPKPK